jgi:hypothetical protein
MALAFVLSGLFLQLKLAVCLIKSVLALRSGMLTQNVIKTGSIYKLMKLVLTSH